MNTIKLKIGKEEDRIAVGVALMKNGYKVWIDKERREKSKVYNYFLLAEDVKREESEDKGGD